MIKLLTFVLVACFFVSCPFIEGANETGTEDSGRTRWAEGFSQGWRDAKAGRGDIQEMIDAAFQAGWEAGYQAAVADMLEDLLDTAIESSLDDMGEIGDDDMESGPPDAGL